MNYVELDNTLGSELIQSTHNTYEYELHQLVDNTDEFYVDTQVYDEYVIPVDFSVPEQSVDYQLTILFIVYIIFFSIIIAVKMIGILLFVNTKP
jgi:hypothetical protein